VEVGPWFTPQEIVQYKNELPRWPVHFHASNLISNLRYQPGASRRLASYLSNTTNDWLSIHIELLPLHVYLISRRLGVHLPPPHIEHTIQQFIKAIDKVKGEVSTPIILENLPSLPVQKYHYAADPKIIREVIETTDCGFLLDLAHVRLAALYHGQAIENHLHQLPLDRVQQIHTSGSRLDQGCLRDAHEPMAEEDYLLLEWALEHCEPTMITLEYFREPKPLREQILRIAEIIRN
jgi:uncharacterized protein (UPF0276 family)